MGRYDHAHWGNNTFSLHLKNLKSLYIFVTVLFITGVIFGAIVVNTLDANQKEGLSNYLGYFFQSLDRGAIAEPHISLQQSLLDHLKTLRLMWLMGLSVIGVPALFIYIFLKGLVIGFTVGFLVNQFSFKGLWFSALSVVPQNLLIIPVYIIVAVAGINFAVTLVKKRLIHYNGTIYPHFFSYSLLVASMAIILLCSSLFEAYVSPALMQVSLPGF